MTDDPVAAALRECERFVALVTLARHAPSSERNGLMEAIRRLESAARDAGHEECWRKFEADYDRRRQMEAYGYDSVAKVSDLIAAARAEGEKAGLDAWNFDEKVATARLAGIREGRLEGYTEAIASRAAGFTLDQQVEERDRLRREQK